MPTPTLSHTQITIIGYLANCNCIINLLGDEQRHHFKDNKKFEKKKINWSTRLRRTVESYNNELFVLNLVNIPFCC